LPEGGRIEIRVAHAPATSADGSRSPRLQLEVRDDGAGFTGDGGSGMGLANTRSRLAALYGDEAALRLECNQPRGVVARVLLPIRMADATNGVGA
jgi:signal transduction histidine kinase